MKLTSNPEARKFYLAAMQRLEDAEVLFQNRRPNGAIYLAGYAVECILKSLIMANTAPGRHMGTYHELKTKYGHDLEALRKKVGKVGLHMPKEVVEQFRRVTPWWDTGGRYEARIQSMSNADTLLRSAAAVVRWGRQIGGVSDE